MDLLNKHQAEHVSALKKNAAKVLPQFAAGDTIAVHIRVSEGQRERVQVFEGICLSRRNRGIGSSFRVRKISYGEGVERTFPLYSPRIARIKLLKKGEVRRAKLYYLRALSGKKARIASSVVSGAASGGELELPSQKEKKTPEKQEESQTPPTAPKTEQQAEQSPEQKVRQDGKQAE